MKLAINGRFLTQPVTGVQRYAREFVETLDERMAAYPGLTVELLTPKLETPPPAYRHVVVRQVGRLRGHLWEQLDLPRALRGADVLFCPGNTAPLAVLVSRIPCVVTVHDLAFRDFPETVSRSFRMVYEFLIPAIMRRAARIITVSEAERSRMLRHFPGAAARLKAVANGGLPRQVPQAQPSDPQPPEAPFLLFVGAFNKRKNIGAVLEASRQLLAERPALKAVMVGGGAGIYQSIDMAEAKADSRLIFAGKLSDAALVAYYKAASVLLFPSFHEASGLPPVEAMANGCPVVVSDIPALRERCGDAALYCDPHDVGTLVQQVRAVLDDPALAQRLSTEGRARAAQFTWANCVDASMHVIEEAVHAR